MVKRKIAGTVSAGTILVSYDQCLLRQTTLWIGRIYVMPRRYHAQRRHIVTAVRIFYLNSLLNLYWRAVLQLDALLYQLFCLSFYLSPSLFNMILRLLIQLLCTTTREMSPTMTSLGSFLFFPLFSNSLSVWNHATKGSTEGRSVILDFVGLGAFWKPRVAWHAYTSGFSLCPFKIPAPLRWFLNPLLPDAYMLHFIRNANPRKQCGGLNWLPTGDANITCTSAWNTFLPKSIWISE